MTSLKLDVIRISYEHRVLAYCEEADRNRENTYTKSTESIVVIYQKSQSEWDRVSTAVTVSRVVESRAVSTKFRRTRMKRREVFGEVQMAAVEGTEPTDKTERRISMQVSTARPTCS